MKSVYSFILFVIRLIKSVINCKDCLVDKETYNTRLDICNKCPFLKSKRCQKCGCFVKYKTKFTIEKCPLDKW